MEKIKIITDSTADLPKHIIDKYEIEVLPLLVNIGNKVFKDGVDIKTSELITIMKEDGTFPTTSQVNPQRQYDIYKKYLDEGYKILVLTLSSKMSGTYQSGCIAKEMLGSDDLIVIDSLNVTAGLGVLVIKACKLKEDGFTIKEIEKEIIKTIPHVKSALAFDKLDNLVIGGRLPKAAAVIGNLLGIKLILEVKNGEMAVQDKVRGTKKAVKTILDYADKCKINKKETSILLHIDAEEVRALLKENLETVGSDFIESEVGCVVGTHSGPGACGIFFIEQF